MGAGRPRKDAFTIVHYCAGFAVHQARSAHHVAAKGRPNGLMSKADAKNGDLACEVADQIDADTRFLRRAWTREK
jgi:hypothetical protein